jgi:hypothetical protein
MIEQNECGLLDALRFLCSRLHDASKQLEALPLARIESRPARLLLQLAYTTASVREDVKINPDLSQGQLATLLGASRPADSDEVSHRFRPKPATCSDRSQPGVPREASLGGGAV